MVVSNDLRILVIDGQALIAMEAAEILKEALPCTPVVATWSTLAAEYRQATQFDVIVMDCEFVPEEVRNILSMPSLAQAARIYLTTDIQALDPRTVADAPVVEKPILPAKLVAAVKSALLLPRVA